jgi:hypothetical protein
MRYLVLRDGLPLLQLQYGSHASSFRIAKGGNRYFRDLINRSIGPYLAARTKLEKSDAIAVIVDQVSTTSPTGGFVKKDAASGRWYRIKEAEARDKVGHAIRKAVQRIEDTKPKLAEKLRKESAANLASQVSSGASVESKTGEKETAESKSAPKKNVVAVEQRDRSSISRVAPSFLQDANPARSPRLAQPGFGGGGMLVPLLSHHDALSATQLLANETLGRSHFLTGGLGLSASQMAARGFLGSNHASPYEQALGRLEFAGAAKAHEDAFLNAIKHQEEKRLQEMEYASRLMLSARRQEDINRSLLTGSASPMHPSLFANSAARYAWLPATLPAVNRSNSDQFVNDAASLYGLYEDQANAGAQQKRRFR